MAVLSCVVNTWSRWNRRSSFQRAKMSDRLPSEMQHCAHGNPCVALVVVLLCVCLVCQSHRRLTFDVWFAMIDSTGTHSIALMWTFIIAYAFVGATAAETTTTTFEPDWFNDDYVHDCGIHFWRNRCAQFCVYDAQARYRVTFTFNMDLTATNRSEIIGVLV